LALLTWVLARRLEARYFVRFESTDQDRELDGARERIVADLQWLGLAGDEPPRDQSVMTESLERSVDLLRQRRLVYDDGGAVRFACPKDGCAQWDDLVLGPISVANRDLSDPVLIRSSGAPTFFLASTVDDVSDGVTHILRPDSQSRLTAAQIHIWRGLDARPPAVGHVPAMVEPERTALIRARSRRAPLPGGAACRA